MNEFVCFGVYLNWMCGCRVVQRSYRGEVGYTILSKEEHVLYMRPLTSPSSERLFNSATGHPVFGSWY